jgi:ribosomal protein S18 acetylase RimI-like enzyme
MTAGDHEDVRTAATIELARANNDVAAVKHLFEEYVDWLGIDLRFQSLDEEMATFPAFYELLLLARRDGAPAGAVGLKDLGGGVCEMKRLYVRPAARGLGLGRALSERLVTEARGCGYRVMRLDTLERLRPALAIYRAMGFQEIPAYYDNPEDGVVYMERDL